MGERAPTPREWLEGRPFPWPPTQSLPDGENVRACYCVLDFQVARTRSDQPYLKLSLSDCNGRVEARVWENADGLAPLVRQGAYIGVQGRIEYYQGELQLCIQDISPLFVELQDLELFLPRSRREAAAMDAELDALIDSIADPALRRLLQLVLGPDSEIGAGFRLAPAAKFNHHAFLGGLLEHTLSVTHVCDALAGHYGAELDRDLLVAAGLLHDVGKVREIGARAGFPYTDEGKLLGHILIGLQMVRDAAGDVPELSPARLLLLQHLIAAHQGRFEWQSPREPATLEALVLHYADDLDAKLQQIRELMASATGPWTAYDRSFRRQFLHHLPGQPDAEPVTPEPAMPVPEPAEEGEGRRLESLEPPAAAPRPEQPARAPHKHSRRHGGSGNGFERLSEDTLDLFGDGGA